MNLIILDRDGVINEDSDDFVKSVAEWIPIAGSIEAIARLSTAGFRVYIATNQSGLGRGLFNEQDLQAMHGKMTGLVESAGGSIAGIFYCPHTPEEGCDCRKPKAGLLEQVEAHAGHSAAGAPLIGDSLRDLQAGLAAGCQPVLVRTGKGERTIEGLRGENHQLLKRLQVYDDLAAAVDAILEAKQ